MFEDAKEEATEENPAPQPVINAAEVDNFYELSDYPLTQVQAVLFSQQNYGVNLVLTIKEMPILKSSAAEEIVEEDAEEKEPEYEEIPEDLRIPEEETEEGLKII